MAATTQIVEEELKYESVECQRGVMEVFRDNKEQLCGLSNSRIVCMYEEKAVVPQLGVLVLAVSDRRLDSVVVATRRQGEWEDAVTQCCPEMSARVEILFAEGRLPEDLPVPDMLIIDGLESFVAFEPHQTAPVLFFVGVDDCEEEAGGVAALGVANNQRYEEPAERRGWRRRLDRLDCVIAPAHEDQEWVKVVRQPQRAAETVRVLPAAPGELRDFGRIFHWPGPGPDPAVDARDPRTRIDLLLLHAEKDVGHTSVTDPLFSESVEGRALRVYDPSGQSRAVVFHKVAGYKLVSAYKRSSEERWVVVVFFRPKEIAFAYTFLGRCLDRPVPVPSRLGVYAFHPDTLSVLTRLRQETFRMKIARFARDSAQRTTRAVYAPVPGRARLEPDVADGLVRMFSDMAFDYSEHTVIRGGTPPPVPQFEGREREARLKQELRDIQEGRLRVLWQSIGSDDDAALTEGEREVQLAREILCVAHYFGLLSQKVAKPHAPSALFVPLANPGHAPKAATIRALAVCVRKKHSALFQTPDRASALLYAHAPGGSHVVLGSYGSNLRELVEALFERLIGNRSCFSLDCAPVDLARLFAAVSSDQHLRMRQEPVSSDNLAISFLGLHSQFHFYKVFP